MSDRRERERQRYNSDPEYKEKRKANARLYSQKNREKVREQQKTYRENNKEAIAAANREWHQNDPEKSLGYNLKKYGITPDQHNELLKKQGGTCAMQGCGRTGDEEARGNRLHVDHDHQTGAVRGLLCSHHNTGLGKFGDSIEQLQAAIEYLLRFKN